MRWLKKHISPEQMSDQDLLSSYQQNNDMQALGVLFNRYVDLVYGVSLKYLRHSEDSEDAVMNVFELISKKLLTHQVDNFKSWLHVVTKNHCLERIRKNKKTLTVAVGDDLMHYDKDLHHEDEFDFEWTKNGTEKVLKECLNNLPDKQKTAISMFYLDGKSYQDIVSETDAPLNRVRSYIQNGRRNLKICIENKNGRSF